MKKGLFIITIAIMLLTGCTLNGLRDDTALPVISLAQLNSTSIPGIEGSYCYDKKCVDKIGIADLIAEEGGQFMSVFSNRVIAHFSMRPNDVDVAMFTPKGKPDSSCTPTISLQSSNDAFVELCSDIKGKRVLSVTAHFETGNMNYIFPIDVQSPLE